MIHTLLYLIANVLVVLGLSWLLPGFEVNSFWAAAVFLLVLSILHWTIIPVLKILTFPVNFISLGLLGLVINLLAVWFVASNIKEITLIGDFTSQLFTVILVSIGLSLGKAVVDSILGGGNRQD